MSNEYTDKKWMGAAFTASEESDDLKTKVGCIIVNNYNDMVISKGCNYFLKGGLDSFSDEKHDYVIHAEMAALLAPGSILQYTSSATLYVTLEPCLHCARHIAATPAIDRVVFCHSKPKGSGVELLRELGIKVDQFQEELLNG